MSTDISGSGAPTAVVSGQAPLATIKILRLPDVCSVTGLKRAMIYRLQASRRFPQSVKITDYAVGWIDAEVQAWLAERAASRRDRAPMPRAQTGEEGRS